MYMGISVRLHFLCSSVLSWMTFSVSCHSSSILSVLSLIIYPILLIPMLKYVSIVLWANSNGNGGAFALYSLIRRQMKLSLIPNQQPVDREQHEGVAVVCDTMITTSLVTLIMLTIRKTSLWFVVPFIFDILFHRGTLFY